MNRKHKLTAVVITGVLLLSGCSESNNPAASATPASETSTTTVTTTTAETTSADTSTTTTTTTAGTTITETSPETSEAPAETTAGTTVTETTTTTETTAAETSPETSETPVETTADTTVTEAVTSTMTTEETTAAETSSEATETENEIEMYEEHGTLDLWISEINDDSFMCYDIIPLPYTYYVMCDTSEYSEYCAGDQIEVTYYKYYYADEEQYTMCVFPDSIGPSYTQLDPDVDYKPVIYLYPEEKTDIAVTLDYNGTLTLSDPQYNGGWNVTAYPDGTLISGGKEYPYLFWEGRRNYEYDTSEGFCVSGSETEKFLAEKLAYLGLNEREAAEFMEFWLPHMENNPYNIITFAGTDYTDNAALNFSPAPDTLIRVFMVFSPSSVYVDIPAQELEKAPDRNGFTVVEWGGARVVADA